METSTWIAIYMPMFIIFIMMQQQSYIQRHLIVRRRKHRGTNRMTNELLQKYVGQTCKLSGGSYGTTVKGRIVEVNENWVEVETTKGRELINAEFVQSIKVIY
jgi:hypothetical protein